MKIFRVCPRPQHLNRYRNKSDISTKSFNDQIAILRAENFLLPGGWSEAMCNLGHEVFETLYDDQFLNARWLIENNKSQLLQGNDWLDNALEEQVKSFAPDVIFIYAGAFNLVCRSMREKLREIVGNKVQITGFWGDELPAKTTYSNYFGDIDFVFTSCSEYTKYFEASGIQAFTSGNAFDPTIEFKQNNARLSDVTFSGTTGYGYPDHIKRYEHLNELLQKSNINILSNESNFPYEFKWRVLVRLVGMLSMLPVRYLNLLRRIPKSAIKKVVDWAILSKEMLLKPEYLVVPYEHKFGAYFFEKKPLKKIFPGRVNPLLDGGKDYMSMIANSKIVINFHRDENADIGNIRCFEATGVGACLLTDRGESLSEFFDVENEVVTFNTVDECLSKIDYLLSNPSERERIARNGQKKTLQNFTVQKRCEYIDSVLRNKLLQSV